jgi:hypothetical protein
MKPVKVILIIVGIIIFGTSLCFAAPNPSGYYIISGLGDETQSNNPWSELARIYLDGGGNGRYYPDPDNPAYESFTYSIAADGQLTITAGADVFHGIVSADGSVFTFVETNTGEPGINVGIKESTGMSNASANGYYRMSSFGDDTDFNSPWSEVAGIELYGNGNGYYYNDNDPEENGPFTYSIASNGRLTINAGGDIFHGIVSADGSIFTFAETLPGEAGIDVGIKKSSQLAVFTISGGVTNVHRPDGSMHTYIAVDIGNDFSGILPDDISIAVTGPSGLLPYDKSDFIYYPQFREFFLSIPGSPDLGTYNFTVWGDSSTGTATDTQSVNKVIPIPDVNSFSPADGATVGSETPTFSWGEVTLPGTTIYYRLEINDDQDNRVYATDRTLGMLSHKVPAGFLTANKTYRWRVRAVDNSTFVTVQNRSHSNWVNFTIRLGMPGIPLLLLDE